MGRGVERSRAMAKGRRVWKRGAKNVLTQGLFSYPSPKLIRSMGTSSLSLRNLIEGLGHMENVWRNWKEGYFIFPSTSFSV